MAIKKIVIKLILKIRFIIDLITKILFQYERFVFMIFDRKNLPIEGDSITVNGLQAIFKKKEK